MKNPVNLVKALVNGIGTAGRAVGKGQRVLKAVTKDEDGDGTPEYKEAFNGLMKMVDKFKLETLPALKEFWEKFIVLGSQATAKHLKEYAVIYQAEVHPNVKSVFESARKAALQDDKPLLPEVK